jgi:Mn2+/Fe2+ NRAMP family transporter
MNALDVFLGIMSAIGGNVDMGQLVFTIDGGAQFGFMLLWVVVVGSVGIILYSEMCGRVAVVTRKPVFDLIRDEIPRPLGLTVLVASTGVNLLTCTANIGGATVVLQLLFGGEHRLVMVIAAALLLAVLGFLKLEPIERIFGLMGLGLVVFVFTAIAQGRWPPTSATRCSASRSAACSPSPSSSRARCRSTRAASTRTCWERSPFRPRKRSA